MRWGDVLSLLGILLVLLLVLAASYLVSRWAGDRKSTRLNSSH